MSSDFVKTLTNTLMNCPFELMNIGQPKSTQIKAFQSVTMPYIYSSAYLECTVSASGRI